jgi:hypothetical protein
MRKKGEGEKWKRLTDVTADLSGAAIARFHFSPFSIFPLLTPRFRWLNSYRFSIFDLRSFNPSSAPASRRMADGGRAAYTGSCEVLIVGLAALDPPCIP